MKTMNLLNIIYLLVIKVSLISSGNVKYKV